jgi:hypothetical protein
MVVISAASRRWLALVAVAEAVWLLALLWLACRG